MNYYEKTDNGWSITDEGKRLVYAYGNAYTKGNVMWTWDSHKHEVNDGSGWKLHPQRWWELNGAETFIIEGGTWKRKTWL